MGKLGQLLTIRQQRAVTQQEEQNAQQRANIAHYDWNQHIGEDGTLDVESFASDPTAPIIFGDQYADYLAKTATVKQAQLTQKQTLLNLRTEQRRAFSEMMGALRSDADVTADNEVGRRKVNDEMIKFGQIYGADALPVLGAYAPGFNKAPQGKLADALRITQMQAAHAENQQAAQLPQFANTGSTLHNVNPNAAGNPEDLKLTLPPGAVMTTDANGRTFIVNPQAPGNPRLVGGGGGGTAPAGPNAPPDAPTFVQPVPGQKDLEDHVTTVRKADADYGANRHVNEEILKLSSDTSTGPGSALWHTGALGKITGTFGGNAAADYQKIGAYLDRQAAMSSQQMGLPETNAGLQTAANLSGTTEYTPEALQTKVKLTDAMVEGSHQYRKGLDKVIGTGPNQDLSKLQTFRGQWADNFDPNVFLVENAIRRGDKAELARIKEEVGTRGMAELKAKSENLRRLENGELLK
jgi:hypothetical protein